MLVTVFRMFKMFLPPIQTEFTKVTRIYDHFIVCLFIIKYLRNRMFDSFLARDLLRKAICGPHVEKFEHAWSRAVAFNRGYAKTP
jgi:hypothetical protein